MKIQFLGASGEVTGSSYLVTCQDGMRLLVDMGMFQGPSSVENLNYLPFIFNPANLTAVFVTHAHLDHCGRLPLLVKNGYFNNVFMTSPTRSLVELSLNDSVKVSQENRYRTPLYGYDDVDKLLKLIRIAEYNQEFKIDNFVIKFVNAGHILGSASIEVTDTLDNKKVVFSGDLGNTPEDIIMPIDYVTDANYVVMECTYGDKQHKTEDASLTIQEEINNIEKTGGVLLIPAFSLERTQELLHIINHLKANNKVDMHTPVFLDSPMGIHATTIFKQYKQFYNPEMLSHKDDPFSFSGLVITDDERDSKDIIKALPPKVIIAGSGMMSGGRILGHARNYMPDARTRILFVGYQAEETLGRKILEGHRNVIINRQNVKVRAHVRQMESLSSHADSEKLINWVEHIKNIQKIFLVHSEDNIRHAFKEKLMAQFRGVGIALPYIDEEFNL